MKLFNKTKNYILVTDMEMNQRAWLFALRHRVSNTFIDARNADGSYMVSFTTLLDRAELAKKLRGTFGETHNVRIKERVVLLTRKIES